MVAEDRERFVHLVAKIEGVVLPSWLVLVLAGTAVVASLAALDMARELDKIRQTNSELRREVRILQLHVSDVESVLKSRGIATTRDFAAWEDGSAPALRGDNEDKKE